MQQNKIDIGLIGKPNGAISFDFYPICNVQDIFVSTKTYIQNLKYRESAIQSTFTTSENLLQNAHLLLLDQQNITRQYMDHYFQSNHINPKHLLEITSMDLLIEFAKIGLGVAGVIKEFVLDELTNQTLIEISLKVPLHKREIGFSIRKNSSISAEIREFIEERNL